MSGLTLIQIGLVLHYHYSPVEHPYIDTEPKAFGIAIRGLIDAGLLVPHHRTDEYSASYKTTEKAAVYVEAIRALPLPVNQWVMP